MSYKIFIDSNIYLRFYDSNSKEYKKLLKSLTNLKGNIIITKQICDEVLRNKAQVFSHSFNNHLANVKAFSSVFLPEHLDDTQNEIKLWNENRVSLKKENIKQVEGFNKIYKKILEEIMCSKDSVSAELEKIFSSAIECTDKEYLLAQKRKEKGNPPGKHEDPIGDQLNWEILLNNIGAVNELFIISNDYDFFIFDNEQCYLNPLLYKEIRSKNPHLKIYCFNALSDALQKMNKAHESKVSLPKKTIMEEIKIEERQNPHSFDSSGTIYYNPTTYYHPDFNVNEEVLRIRYLTKQNLISDKQGIIRLINIGFTEQEASKCLN